MANELPELGLVPSDDEAPDAPNWKSSLIHTDKGVKACLANAIHALTLSLQWRGVLAFNAFDGSVVKLRRPPMRDNECPESYELGEWNDTDTALATAWLSREAEVHVQPNITGRAVYAVAQQRRFHPVTDYLNSLEWKGTPRLDKWLHNYLGAPDSEYSSAVGIRWMISAVARVFEPGCKADHALVLEGKQGVGKSTAVELLASAPWYSDTPIVFGEKDSYEALRGVWIYELAELAALRRSEVESQKAYISKKHDRYRRPYGEGPILWKRQTVFIGTTNDERYLVDPTGNRRFWPVRCGSINLAQLSQDRDQLWAEAVVRYREKEAWHLDSPALIKLASEEQNDRVHPDDWDTLVSRWLETAAGQLMLSSSEPITVADVLQKALSMKPENIDRSSSTRCGQVMTRLGWTSTRRLVGDRRVHFLIPPSNETEPQAEPDLSG